MVEPTKRVEPEFLCWRRGGRKTSASGTPIIWRGEGVSWEDFRRGGVGLEAEEGPPVGPLALFLAYASSMLSWESDENCLLREVELELLLLMFKLRKERI